MITLSQLLHQVRREFALNWYGEHGGSHWARVLRHGRFLAGETGANLRVIELFAVLHDSQRQNEFEDPEHGARAAVFARSLGAERLGLSRRELGQLMVACAHHSAGYIAAEDITIECCWDADRLDIGRVGPLPDPKFLCTSAARDSLVRGRAFLWSRGQKCSPALETANRYL